MRAVHLIKATGLAGAEAHLLVLLRGLRARGVDAHLLMLFQPDGAHEDVARAARDLAIPIRAVRLRGDLDPTIACRLASHLRRLRPQLLHTHLLHADVHGLIAARLAGVRPIVTTRHNQNPFRARFAFRQMHRLYWRHVDAIVAVSEDLARFAVRVEGAPVGKIRTIHHGLEPPDPGTEPTRAQARAALGVADNELLVGMVGRLTTQKGFAHGLRAMADVAGAHPTAKMVVLGDGPLRNDLDRRAQALGIEDRVRFLGWRADAAQLMRGMELLLVPSLWEGFGIVVLEAMLRDLPVVASRVGALPEIVVDEESGLLAPPGDALRWAAAVNRLLREEGLRRRLAERAHRRALERFTAEVMIDRTLRLYRELVPASVTEKGG